MTTEAKKRGINCEPLAATDASILTVTRRESGGRSQTLRTRDALPDTVAHVAPRGGFQMVDEEAGAVLDFEGQFRDAAFPVTVDAPGCRDDAVRYGRDLPCKRKDRGGSLIHR